MIMKDPRNFSWTTSSYRMDGGPQKVPFLFFSSLPTPGPYMTSLEAISLGLLCIQAFVFFPPCTFLRSTAYCILGPCSRARHFSRQGWGALTGQWEGGARANGKGGGGRPKRRGGCTPASFHSPWLFAAVLKARYLRGTNSLECFHPVGTLCALLYCHLKPSRLASQRASASAPNSPCRFFSSPRLTPCPPTARRRSPTPSPPPPSPALAVRTHVPPARPRFASASR